LRHKNPMGEYLALFSVRYDIGPEKLLNALRKARDDKKAHCGQFSVECRGETNSKIIFLIKNDRGAVAQFKVSNDFLLELGDSLKKFMDADRVRSQLFKKRKMSRSRVIRDVRPGMTNVNLKAKVLEVAEPKRVVTRHGVYARVAKALIEDETGTINLYLWNEQINSFSVGDIVQIGNAKASTFKGEMQLTIGKRGGHRSAEGCRSQIAAPVLLPATGLKNKFS
jgi:replication factor A1